LCLSSRSGGKDPTTLIGMTTYISVVGTAKKVA
jgi:hypothetical protein